MKYLAALSLMLFSGSFANATVIANTDECAKYIMQHTNFGKSPATDLCATASQPAEAPNCIAMIQYINKTRSQQGYRIGFTLRGAYVACMYVNDGMKRGNCLQAVLKTGKPVEQAIELCNVNHEQARSAADNYSWVK